MGVFKRGGVWWYKFYFAGQFIRESAKSTSKTVAKDAENQRRRELEQGYHNLSQRRETRIRLRVDRYVGEDRQAHLLSVFGNDADVGAITAAVHEKATFTLTFPDGTAKEVSLGEHASCYKGAISLSDRKHPVRHLVAVSEELHTNGAVGRTILLRYRRDEAWATLVSFLGLPAEPSWADHVLSVVEEDERIKELDGVGCQPVLVSATTEESLGWIAEGLRSESLKLPEENGPIVWPQFTLRDVLVATEFFHTVPPVQAT